MSALSLLAAPADFTLPRSGSTTARRVVGAYLKWLARELSQIPMGRFAAPVFDSFTDARARLLGLLKTPKAGLVYASLRRPSISVLVRCLHGELWGAGDVGRLDRMLGELATALRYDGTGAPRVVQRADGFDATVVAGEITWRAGRATGARPGRVVRS